MNKSKKDFSERLRIQTKKICDNTEREDIEDRIMRYRDANKQKENNFMNCKSQGLNDQRED